MRTGCGKDALTMYKLCTHSIREIAIDSWYAVLTAAVYVREDWNNGKGSLQLLVSLLTQHLTGNLTDRRNCRPCSVQATKPLQQVNCYRPDLRSPINAEHFLLVLEINFKDLWVDLCNFTCSPSHSLRGCSQMTSSFLGGTLAPPLPLVIIRHFWSTPPLPLCAMTSFIAYYRTK